MSQKMDKNKDGVVTIDEFLETCQRVFMRFFCFPSLTPNHLSSEINDFFFFKYKSHLQDENIMQSMHMFDNVI